MASLTERQQEVKNLLEQGKKPAEIGEALGISTNAVYQQIRRMRGGKGKRGRQSGARVATTPRPSVPRAEPVKQAPPATPLQSLRSRRAVVLDEIKRAEAEVTMYERHLKAAQADAEKVSARHKDELARLAAAEAALTGTKQATPRAPKKAAPATKAAPQAEGTPPSAAPASRQVPETAPANGGKPAAAPAPVA